MKETRSQMATCGAKTRDGTPCRRPPGSNGRCRLHGGASTGPASPSTKHGIYSTRYSEEELRDLAELRDADLTAEIALARIMLCRLLKAAPEPIGMGEPSKADDGTDWWGLADRFLGRIGRLVEQHARTVEVAEMREELETLVAELKGQGA